MDKFVHKTQILMQVHDLIKNYVSAQQNGNGEKLTLQTSKKFFLWRLKIHHEFLTFFVDNIVQKRKK